MSDKSYEIGIKTTADTSGARETQDSLQLLSAEEQRLLKIKSQFLTAAEREVAEVKRLVISANEAQGAYNRTVPPIEKATKATKDLANATAQVGAQAGRKGNSAMAILEFSRGLEDLQYGIRGVLNNIPSLVLALGGGAGLAGVISIAAVLGSQLFSLLSKGAGDAAKDTTDYLEVFKSLSKEFGNAALEVEKLRGDAIDKNADKRKANAAEDLRAADEALKLEQQRIKGDGSVAIARERLNLLRTEDQLARATGEAALKLAKQREAIQKNIVALQEREVELLRQSEEKAAQNKVAVAQGTLESATASTDRAREKSGDAAAEATRITQALANAIEARAKNVEALNAERSAAIERQRNTSNPLENIQLSALISKLEAAIEKALKDPTPQEAQLTVRKEEADATAKQASDNLNKASEDQKSAADELKKAAAALAALREVQGQQRTNDSQIKAIGTETEALQKKQKSEGVTVEGINQLVDSIGTGGGEDLQKAAQELSRMAADNLLSAEELSRANVLLAQYGAQIQRLGQEQIATLQNLKSQMDQLARDVAALRTNNTQAPR